MKRITYSLLLGCSLLMESFVSAAPPKQVVVGADDTIYGIAYNHGLPTRALISANNLKPPYALYKGQILIIPAPNEHVVGAGETLPAIAEQYGVNVDVLAQENSLSSPFYVKPGDHLIIPSRDTESMTEALQAPPTQEIVTTTLAPLPLVKTKPTAGSSSVVPSAPPLSSALPSDLAAEIASEKGIKSSEPAGGDSSSKPELMGNLAQGNAGAPVPSLIPPKDDEDKPKKEKKKKEEKKEEKKPAKKEEKAEVKETIFIWPVEGEIIAKFSPKNKNDGINIKVPEGTSVKAASDGEVMYAGNELKDFGKLVLVKHKDGWITAYAYNSELLVKKGDKVKQGEVLAKSGKTGVAKEPQVHFEIRKGKQPIDPSTKLES
ncbi:MAG: peptidoglycan DD-metalloendopeptidase family protein [Alphaproteobacteria bacterium]|nr:peptidoglycan DD-metalloendopeptidase family protein [Alphaproteobacteria bacterium]